MSDADSDKMPVRTKCPTLIRTKCPTVILARGTCCTKCYCTTKFHVCQPKTGRFLVKIVVFVPKNGKNSPFPADLRSARDGADSQGRPPPRQEQGTAHGERDACPAHPPAGRRPHRSPTRSAGRSGGRGRRARRGTARSGSSTRHTGRALCISLDGQPRPCYAFGSGKGRGLLRLLRRRDQPYLPARALWQSESARTLCLLTRLSIACVLISRPLRIAQLAVRRLHSAVV